jgi:hypothetical protein
MNKSGWPLLFLWLFTSCVKNAPPSNTSCDYTLGTEVLTNELTPLYVTQGIIPLFPNTTLITIPPYSYNRNGVTYNINPQRVFPYVNESCTFLDSVDLHDPDPLFILPVPDTRLYAVTISDTILNFRVNDPTSIDNVQNILWTWNSGFSTGIISGGKLIVDYLDGKVVKNGNVDSLASLNLLSPGKVYFLSMWSWNDEGTTVVQSTPCIPFLVGSRLFDYSNYLFVAGTWTLQSATDLTNQVALGNKFQVPTLQFGGSACSDGVSSTQLYYLEDSLPESISFINDSIFTIPVSTNFKNPITLQYICDHKMVFTTNFGDTLFSLIYTK